MSLFSAACPVRSEEQSWIETELRWLATEFGDDALRNEVVLPNNDFFPGVYEGSATDVAQVVEIVRQRGAAETTNRSAPGH